MIATQIDSTSVGLASVLVFQHMLNHQQVHCLYSSKWEALIEETCYDEFTVIDAAEAGVIGLDGSQTFCGPLRSAALGKQKHTRHA